MDLRHLTFIVLFYLCAGTFVSMGILKQSQVGRNFYLIHGLGASACALFVFLLVGTQAIASGALVWFIAYLLFSSLFSFNVGKNKHLTLLFFILGLICTVAAITLDVSGSIPPYLQKRALANSLLSAALLGLTMSAMLLGHWYLNQPKLSIDELKRLTLILLAVIGLRFLLGTVGIIRLIPHSEIEMYRYFAGNPGVFVLMRWFWGILGPAILAYFIWGTVKIRSTQSATGILYVAVVFVLIGEILSNYLSFTHGIAF
jgi:hypothetical protein